MPNSLQIELGSYEEDDILDEEDDILDGLKIEEKKFGEYECL